MFKTKEKKWRFLHSDHQSLRDSLSQEINISKILAELLINRQVKDVSEVEKFLYPKLEHLHSPFLLKDISKVVERVKRAISKKERILIFGDWDVDGICSCALLTRVLSQLQANLSYFIPSREEYSLSSNLIKQFHQEKVNLIITVDCGISNIEEVVYAHSLGIETIIIDHHEPKEELPEADAIVNPKQKGCLYPFKELAGVGVVFKFIQCLLSSFSQNQGKNLNLHNYIYENYLDLVAIGTIADVVPLIEENRVMVKIGLTHLKNTKKVGLKALLSQLNLTEEELFSKDISWKLAPVLNSAGRMNKTSLGADLLCIKSSAQAINMVEELIKLNRSRKILLKEGTSLISNLFSEQVDLSQEKVVIVAINEGYSGITGILANRLLDVYFRPTIVFSVNGDIAKGSARSLENFNLVEALKYCEDLLIRYGGHKGASGLVIHKDNLLRFKIRINEYAQNLLKDEDLLPELFIDCEVAVEDLTMKLIDEMKLLEPYGDGNPQPLFILRSVDILSCQMVGKNKDHLKLKVGNTFQEIDAIGFNMSNMAKDNLSRCDLAFHFNVNDYKGLRLPQLQIIDLK